MTKQQREVLELEAGEINLVQVLKLAGVAGTGGQAKGLVEEGLVKVNGEVESRKRRQLVDGDVVQVEDGPEIELKLR